DARRGGGKCLVRRRRRDDDDVDVVGGDSRIVNRARGGLEGEVRGGLAVAGEMANLDAGALGDPFVAGVHHLCEIEIRENLGWKICTTAKEDRTHDTQETAALAGSGPSEFSGAAPEESGRRETAARSARMRAIISDCPISMARSMALAKPSASAPPWLFTTTPSSPRKTPPLSVRG